MSGSQPGGRGSTLGYADPVKQREYQRQWKAKRRTDWFADKSCIECGATEELELDHVDRLVKVTHKIWSWSEARREVELAKCEVRCHDCHLDRTRTQVKEWKSTLSDQSVVAIKSDYATGNFRYIDLAQKYGVSKGGIGSIIRGERRGSIV